MVQENPYSVLLNTLRVDADSRTMEVWRLGTVKSLQPLVVETCGRALSGEDLLVNSQLLPNTEALTFSETSGTLSGAVDCSKGSITALQVSGGTLSGSGRFGGVLLVGDSVVLLPSRDGQTFIVLCKVVGA